MFVTCESVVKVRSGPLLGVEGESRTRTLFRAPVLETGVAAITPLRQRCRREGSNLHAVRHTLLRRACMPVSPRRHFRCTREESNLHAFLSALVSKTSVA